MKITKIAAAFLVMAFSGKMMAQEAEKQLQSKMQMINSHCGCIGKI
jgi:hypothetical protein